MNKIYLLFFCIFFSINNIFANSPFWLNKVNEAIKWDISADLTIWVKSAIIYILWFLWLLAVIWLIKWGFQILTSWWEEENFKNWKKTVLYALLGIFVILIAYSLVSWVIKWLELSV